MELDKLEIFGICLVFVMVIVGSICSYNVTVSTLNDAHAKDVFCIKNNHDGYAKVKVSTTEYSDFCKTNNNLKQFVTVDDEFRFINMGIN